MKTTTRIPMIYKFLPLFVLSLLSFHSVNEPSVLSLAETVVTDPKLIAVNKRVEFEEKCKTFYNTLDKVNFSLPQYDSFLKAFEGYSQLNEQGVVESHFLTIIDFSLSSVKERLWVIDMTTKQVVLQSLVAHGKNSGDEFANHFSNTSESFQSSLGFYLTGEAYQGKHGLSLRIDGVEKGINDNARSRAVVIHGADYASESFIKAHGRLGRSLGCPAVPYKIHKELIELIKEKSCVFIYHPSRNYVVKSKLVS